MTTSQPTGTQITTTYESRPNSNVGKYVARCLGMQTSAVTDQSKNSDENHRITAERMVQKLRDKGLWTPDPAILVQVRMTATSVWWSVERES